MTGTPYLVRCEVTVTQTSAPRRPTCAGISMVQIPRLRPACFGGLASVGLIPRGQMAEARQELDVHVLSSKQPEGLGIVLLEAIACGKAVIAFAVAQDTRGLAEAMLELAGNARLRKSLGVEGRKTVESSFRSEMTAREIEKVYRQIRK